jgi:hypothetical protein
MTTFSKHTVDRETQIDRQNPENILKILKIHQGKGRGRSLGKKQGCYQLPNSGRPPKNGSV